jgi:hypothetical protein
MYIREGKILRQTIRTRPKYLIYGQRDWLSRGERSIKR